ncbi:rRNA methyltransferase [Lysobacter sp. H21R4]|uniref:TrmH family RNA methyltransferase n=1 Tax=Lysobacter sp. H21R4 TaxID=2781021 RepID=UPI0018870562|nr:TrmH family RNA methyltransferase [Lysobacter sp. H21R4]QOY63308.1 rRNA methyltransferase [Lysobacter sp. H21R4]
MTVDPWGGRGRGGGSGKQRGDAPAPGHRGPKAPNPYGRSTREEAPTPTAPEGPGADAPAGGWHAANRPVRELRLHGLNAVRAVFERRPEAIRKVYLTQARIPTLQPLLKWCAANRIGYRVVEDEDLKKLAASSHHEGVVADVLRAEPVALADWLDALPGGPGCAVWLDGVGNPHNFGAILRSAAHFGIGAVLLPEHSPLALSGAAARVAEGGAEAVTLVRLPDPASAASSLRSAGFGLAATLVSGGSDLFATSLPERLVYVLGAEGEGMDRRLADACDLRLSIPGSGAVESLNVAAATAVLLAAWRQQH